MATWRGMSVNLVLVLFLVSSVSAEPKHGDFAKRTVTVASQKREYRLVVPKSVDLAKSAPLVISFHGILIDSKDLMPLYTKLGETADRHKFLLAFPNAVDRSWGIAPDKMKSDLLFFDALLSDVRKSYQVDSNRIYVIGMSNGGYFAHVVGRHRSKTVAAVASHSGPLGLETLLGINAPRKFPVLIIHGAKDVIFPVGIARENRDKYKKEGHEVKYVELPDVGHMWGSGANINETIWDFFTAHPLDAKESK